MADQFSVRLEWGKTRRRLVEVLGGIIPYQQFKGAPITSAYIDADTVDERAFENCTDLVSVTFSERIRGIGYGAFAGCSALKAVVFEKPGSWDTWFGIMIKGTHFDVRLEDSPVKDEKIGCFKDCKILELIELPGDTARFDSGTFSGCTALKEITVWEGHADRMRGQWTSVFPDSNLDTINVLELKRDPMRPMAEWEKKRLERDLLKIDDGIFTTERGGTKMVLPTLNEVRLFYVGRETGDRLPARTEDGEPVVFRRDTRLRRRALDARAEQLARANGRVAGWRDSTGRDVETRTGIVGLPSLPQEIWDMIVQTAADGDLYNWTGTGTGKKID